MVNQDVVAAKLSELAIRVDRVRQHRKETAAELAADLDALELVSFNLMLAVQVCVDISSHLIADEGWPAPQTLAEGFARIRDHGVISDAIAQVMSKSVGLRNVVAHGYTGINAEMVFHAAQTGTADLEQFSKQVAAWVTARTAGQ